MYPFIPPNKKSHESNAFTAQLPSWLRFLFNAVFAAYCMGASLNFVFSDFKIYDHQHLCQEMYNVFTSSPLSSASLHVYACASLSGVRGAYAREVHACLCARECGLQPSLCDHAHDCAYAGVHDHARDHVHDCASRPCEDVRGRAYARAYDHARACAHVFLS
jgi:hypothetical protein